MRFEIEQLPCKNTCPYHSNKDGKVFKEEEILPNRVCPWLYNSVYPYFLGLLYGAQFKFNAQGDCNVCCPAKEGVDTIVRRRKNNGSLDRRISGEMKFVIFAEIVKINRTCPYGHKKGQKIIFPTCMKEHFLCPAALHNVFPLMKLKLPSCIDRNKLRCPDWANVIALRLY